MKGYLLTSVHGPAYAQDATRQRPTPLLSAWPPILAFAWVRKKFALLDRCAFSLLASCLLGARYDGDGDVERSEG